MRLVDADYIKASVKRQCDNCRKEGMKWMADSVERAIIEGLDNTPTAQPQRRTGRWIRKTDTRFGEMLNDILICSECGIAFPTLNMIRRSYCPSCGARMEVRTDE